MVDEVLTPLIDTTHQRSDTDNGKINHGGSVRLSTRRRIVLSALLVPAYVSWGALISLIPPFYPSEAENRGATPTEYGSVFGFAFLAAFISAPVFGAYGDRIGAKLLYNGAGFLQGLSGVLFGLLSFVEDKSTFLACSYLLRLLDGASDAAVLNSITSILMVIYPGKVARVVAMGETLFGIGLALGPVIGAKLYSAGGFGVPFWTVGGLILMLAIIMHFLVPNVKSPTQDPNQPLGHSDFNIHLKPLKLMDILKSPSILTPCLDIMVVYAGVNGTKGMTEVYLKETVGATQDEVGQAFLNIGMAFTISSFCAGMIADRLRRPVVGKSPQELQKIKCTARYGCTRWAPSAVEEYIKNCFGDQTCAKVSIFGNLTLAIGYLFLAPASFVNFRPSLSRSQSMMAVLGIGQASVMASTFGRSQKAAVAQGYKQDIATYLLISGVWSSCMSFGSFIGPTLGGAITGSNGFEATTSVYFAMVTTTALVDSLELCWTIWKTRNT